MVKVEFGRITIPPPGRSVPPDVLRKGLQEKFRGFIRAIKLHQMDIGLSFRSRIMDHTIKLQEGELQISGDLLVPAAIVVAAIARGDDPRSLKPAFEAMERYLDQKDNDPNELNGPFVELVRRYAAQASYERTASLVRSAGAALVYDGEEPGE